MDYEIIPGGTLRGQMMVQGDKSVSHRALILGAIAEGKTRIYNLCPGRDVQSTMTCLRDLGVRIEHDGEEVVVHGVGPRGLQPCSRPLDAGNSGTTLRLLAGVLAGQRFRSTLTGDSSLRQRPMARVIEPLTRMGARIESQPGGLAPLVIEGGPLSPIDYHMPVASAQVKSAVLLAGLYASGETTVVEPAQTRDHTERLLPLFGAELVGHGGGIGVRGPAVLRGTSLSVPGDISAATFFIAAAAMVPGARVEVLGVGVNPTRTGALDVLRAMGARITVHNERGEGEPVADVLVEGAPLRAAEVDGSLVPRLIDELPVLAVVATQARGLTRIRGAKELRVKESDRIRAVAANLRAMGAQVEELEDGLSIPGPQQLRGASLESFGDHRIAMSFAVAALVAKGPTVIRSAECVDISFPGFFAFLEALRHG
ncbi:MAG: 3-phosphoshikimate 1-carboxyvinyltransferase [candidate division KSB1 bacterium]|nr:3-phosphoshikimate 1-carboxyvinyltransferase [candidate division KSB1 bacterium]